MPSGFTARTFCETCRGTGKREGVTGFIVKRIVVRNCGKCSGTGRRRMTMPEQEADGQGTLFGRSDEVQPQPKTGLPDGG